MGTLTNGIALFSSSQQTLGKIFRMCFNISLSIATWYIRFESLTTIMYYKQKKKNKNSFMQKVFFFFLLKKLTWRVRKVSNGRVQLYRTLFSHFTHAIETASWHAAKRLNASPYMLLDAMYIRSLLFAIMPPTSLVSWSKIYRSWQTNAYTMHHTDNFEYHVIQ